MEPIALARAIIDCIEAVKGEAITLLDLREATILADYFIICNGTNMRQLRAIANRIREDIKDEHRILPHHVEGEPGSGWFLIDYLDVVVHVFSEELRDYYDLDTMWVQQGGKVLLTIQ